MYNTAKESPKPNQYGIFSSLLHKTIKNSSNPVWKGGPFFFSHPVESVPAFENSPLHCVELNAWYPYLEKKCKCKSSCFFDTGLSCENSRFFGTETLWAFLVPMRYVSDLGKKIVGKEQMLSTGIRVFFDKRKQLVTHTQKQLPLWQKEEICILIVCARWGRIFSKRRAIL